MIWAKKGNLCKEHHRFISALSISKKKKENITQIYKEQNNKLLTIWNIMQFKIIVINSLNHPMMIA